MVKVTIVGAGAVGEAIANDLFIGNTVTEIWLYDIVKDRTRGLVMDFCHAQLFHTPRVRMAEDWVATANSDIIVITAGARQRPGESRRDLRARNYEILKSFVPEMAAASPQALVCVVTNPCDILTKLVAELSGLPRHQVFGSGTLLDTSRFRVELASIIGVDPRHVHAYILGEHGDSSVACVAGVSVAGMPLSELVTPDQVRAAHANTVRAAHDVIALRGYTNTAIGCAVGKIVKAIVHDTHEIMPLSFSAMGRLGLDDDTYIALPCVVTRAGIKPWSVLMYECEERLVHQAVKAMNCASEDAAEEPVAAAAPAPAPAVEAEAEVEAATADAPAAAAAPAQADVGEANVVVVADVEAA